jgi:multidrug resistance efflux pump
MATKAEPEVGGPVNSVDATSVEKPKARSPATKIARLVLLVIAVLVAWYVVTDRMAPYSSRGSVSGYVAQIAPQVAGQVTEVYVQDNQIVGPGDPLFQLDRRPFELAVRQAEASLEQSLQTTSASTASIASAQARVAQAKANLENVRGAANRADALVARGVSSKAQADQAHADLRSAEADVKAAEADLESALLQLGEGGVNNPQVKAAQAQLEQAQMNLLFSTVAAPTRGVVTNLQLAIGQYLSPGLPGLTFIDARGAWIVADFRENQIGNVEPGDSVELVFDAVPGRIFNGRVHSIAFGIDPGRTSAGGLAQNAPENRWFEPARRMPLHIELDGGLANWPEKVRAGGKVSAVVYASGTDNPIAWAAGGLLRLRSYLSYLY